MLIIASFDGRISMELRHLATFRILATTLNFTQTAALLGYVQSSVSAQIQELEAELGVLLFDRLNRRVILTDEGQYIESISSCSLGLEMLSIYCQNTAKKDTRKHLLLTDKQVSAVLRNHPLMRNKPRFLKNGQAN